MKGPVYRTLADLERKRPNVDPERRTLAVSLETLIVAVVVSVLALGWITFQSGVMVGMERGMANEARALDTADYYRKLLHERLETLELAAHLIADEDRAMHSQLSEQVPGWPEIDR